MGSGNAEPSCSSSLSLFPLLSLARSLFPGPSSRKRKPPTVLDTIGGLRRDAGDGLLSRALSGGVPSALQGLTAVFGMGTGVAPAL